MRQPLDLTVNDHVGAVVVLPALFKFDLPTGFVQHQEVIARWPGQHQMLRVHTVGNDVDVVVVIFVAVDRKKCLVVGHANRFERLGGCDRGLVNGRLLASLPRKDDVIKRIGFGIALLILPPTPAPCCPST
jgi:hypothetical protein